jgi:hypothetical protein
LKDSEKKTTLNVDDPPAARIAEAIGEDNVAAKPPEHLFKMLQFHIAEKKKQKKKTEWSSYQPLNRYYENA